jgi:NhaP-type Na+/H+ or K+/H+ antiporter
LKEASSNKYINYLKPEILHKEIKKFKELIAEATFLVRTMFFILFGFQIKLSDVMSTESLYLSVSALSFMFLIRAIQLWVSKMSLFPKIFIAPRGLINILLFISIPLSQKIPMVSEALMIQIILLTFIIMTLGLMFVKKDKPLAAEKAV